ncbi:hypothetical protein BC829DRAFT_93218 [Chytridium lagenaria]|nr:hypothetical protein BC829DRAFT_93218 [Chytridium lagenaria]
MLKLVRLPTSVRDLGRLSWTTTDLSSQKLDSVPHPIYVSSGVGSLGLPSELSVSAEGVLNVQSSARVIPEAAEGLHGQPPNPSSLKLVSVPNRLLPYQETSRNYAMQQPSTSSEYFNTSLPNSVSQAGNSMTQAFSGQPRFPPSPRNCTFKPPIPVPRGENVITQPLVVDLYYRETNHFSLRFQWLKKEILLCHRKSSIMSRLIAFFISNT